MSIDNLRQEAFAMVTERQPLLVDAEGAAHYLSCSRSTVYALIDRGELKGVKIGRARRFALSELTALVERLQAVEGAEAH